MQAHEVDTAEASDPSETSDEETPLPFDPIVPVFRQWAQLKNEVVARTTAMNKLRDRIITDVEQRGYRDHKGSQYVDLPFPLVVGDLQYLRIKRERRVAITPDLEAAERITRSKGEDVFNRAFPPVPTLDCDALYVLLQEGELTEDDMDSIMVQKESWAFRGILS